MGAPSKRARKIRRAAEFDTSRLSAQLATPKSSGVSLTSWTLAQIFEARDAQLRGHFALPARMAESMYTDDALAVARENRLAPQRCIKVQIRAAKGARGSAIAAEAEALFGQEGVGITPDTVASIHSCLIDHDIAFGEVVATPREDGSRVDFALRTWPIEHVRWDMQRGAFMTRVDPESAAPGELAYNAEVEITHGDGRWVIFQRFELDPFKHAAILSAALVWARHAYGIRDWAKSSVAHGNAKMIGEMPEGVALQDENGDTEDAVAFISLLRDMVSSDAPVGIRPAGAKTEFVTNTSTAWQVFSELVANAERAAARIYLGTDGTLGTNGGAPGVDIESLFGVASTKVQGDLTCIQRGIDTGVIEPWCAVNFGDSTLAPSRKYLLPDPDADAARASLATRTDAYFNHIKTAKELGFVVDQAYVDLVAELNGVEPSILPVETDAKAPTIQLAPTDIARVVSVNEARASAGLGPLTLRDGSEDIDGFLTVEQFAAKKSAIVDSAPQPAAPLPEVPQ